MSRAVFVLRKASQLQLLLHSLSVFLSQLLEFRRDTLPEQRDRRKSEQAEESQQLHDREEGIDLAGITPACDFEHVASRDIRTIPQFTLGKLRHGLKSQPQRSI